MMDRQLRFKRQGDSLVCVNEWKEIPKQKEANQKRSIVGSIIVFSAGLFLLFMVDGGIGVLTASIIETVKWTHRTFVM